MITSEIRARFENKYLAEPMSGCWLWEGRLNGGYGRFGYRCVIEKAHRVSWEIHRGPIPEGLCVLHRCDNGGCVNPGHLFIGTKLDNARDRDNKGRDHDKRGVKNGRAKLTEADVVAIRSDERIPRIIADAYGVGKTVIYYIRAGKIWKHVPW